MIGFGLIGCGRIADKHIASLAACRDAQLTALCDIRPERMEEAELAYRRSRAGAADAGSIAHYDDVSRLLADDRVQAVIICTHSAMHAELAVRALQAGKHLVLEKPMTLSSQDAEAIIEQAAAHGLEVQICHQLRYRPVMRRIKQLIDQGSFGRLYLGTATIRLRRSAEYYAEASWRGSWDQDGGMLLNQGIHLIDLLQWFLGDAAHVYSQMAKTGLPKQTEDVATGLIRFQNGAIGVVEANTISQPDNLDNEIALFGDKGTIRIGGIKMNEIRRWYVEDGAQPPDPQQAAADEHRIMYESFISRLMGDRSAMNIDAVEGSKALGIIFAMYESVRRAREVELPVASFSTTMMSELEGWS